MDKSIQRGLVLGATAASIFITGYALGVKHTRDEGKERYMQDVRRKAKELISKAADDVIKERREQRTYDAKFADIVNPPKSK